MSGFFVVCFAQTGNAPTVDDIEEKRVEAKQGRLCQVVTDQKSECSYDRLLPYFDNNEALAKEASAICNLESKGNPNTQSYVDFCRDGNPISYGLFQVNILANDNIIPACQGVFQKTMNEAGDDVGCVKKKGDVCLVYDCRVADMDKYRSCVAYVTDPKNNIELARTIYDKNKNWKYWGSYDFCRAKF